MATTLRIDESLYREAKAEAARQGVTITRFIEDALRLKLGAGGTTRQGSPLSLPTFAADAGFPYSPDELRALMHDLDALADASQMGR